MAQDFARTARLYEQLHRKPYTKPIRSPINVGQADGSVAQQPQVTHSAPPQGPRAPHNRPTPDAGSQGGFNRASKQQVKPHGTDEKSPKEAINDAILAQQLADARKKK